jgi:hypothetical protein
MMSRLSQRAALRFRTKVRIRAAGQSSDLRFRTKVHSRAAGQPSDLCFRTKAHSCVRGQPCAGDGSLTAELFTVQPLSPCADTSAVETAECRCVVVAGASTVPVTVAWDASEIGLRYDCSVAGAPEVLTARSGLGDTSTNRLVRRV